MSDQPKMSPWQAHLLEAHERMERRARAEGFLEPAPIIPVQPMPNPAGSLYYLELLERQARRLPFDLMGAC